MNTLKIFHKKIEEIDSFDPWKLRSVARVDVIDDLEDRRNLDLDCRILFLEFDYPGKPMLEQITSVSAPTYLLMNVSTSRKD